MIETQTLLDAAKKGDLPTVTSAIEDDDFNTDIGGEVIQHAAWHNQLEIVQGLLEAGVDPLRGIERSSSLAVYEHLAPTPRSSRHAQKVLEHLASWAYYCTHDISDLVAQLIADGAVLNRSVIMAALERPERSLSFFEGVAKAGVSLDVMWSELPKDRKKTAPVRKTLRDRRVPVLSDLVKAQGTAKATEKALLKTIGKDPKAPIPIGDPRWQAAQKLAYCADGGSLNRPGRRAFEASKLPSWIGSAVAASLPQLPSALATPLATLAPTESAVLAALVAGADGVTPGGDGILAAVLNESIVGDRFPVVEQLLDVGVSPSMGAQSALIAAWGYETPTELLKRLYDPARSTAEERMRAVDRPELAE